MSDAYTARVTALIDALRALTPSHIFELPEDLSNLGDEDTITGLELATDLLVSAAFAVLRQAVTPEVWGSRNLFRLTVKATRWGQALVGVLGGVVVADVLADAVVAGATYQLALQFACRDYVDLDLVAAIVLDKANGPLV